MITGRKLCGTNERDTGTGTDDDNAGNNMAISSVYEPYDKEQTKRKGTG